MGLFNDSTGQRRLDWEYQYTGAQLLPYASVLYQNFFSQEKDARNKLADLMRDMNVNNRDTRVQELERDIKTNGMLREQCDVFRHEFSRNPTKTYNLGLGDVTFFGLTTSLEK